MFRFKVLGIFIALCHLVAFVSGNTESFLLRVPNNFPTNGNLHGCLDSNEALFGHISLQGVNMAKTLLIRNISHVDPVYLELSHLQIDENYQIRICWSAFHPISIDSMGWFIVPHSTNFLNTTSKHARIFMKFEVTSEAYPVPDLNTMIPINVSVINVKLGIPVDLYRVLLYIILVIIGIVSLDRYVHLTSWIKNF